MLASISKERPSGDHTGKRAPVKPAILTGAATGHGRDEHAVFTRSRSKANGATCPVGDELAVRREPRTAPARREQPRLAAPERGCEINAACVPLGAERDAAPVRRKGWLAFVGGVAGEPQRGATGHLLQPDVEAALAFGRIGDHRSVLRNRRIRRQALIRGQGRRFRGARSCRVRGTLETDRHQRSPHEGARSGRQADGRPPCARAAGPGLG